MARRGLHRFEANSAKSLSAEHGARSLLGDRRWLSDRRVLTFVQRDPGHLTERRYKEIDAVAMDDEVGVPLAFFEVKSSVSPLRALRKAASQLRLLRRIVSAAEWGETVRLGAVLIVPEGSDLPAEIDSGHRQLVEDLDAMAALDWDPHAPMVFFMSRTRPWTRALERGWVADEALLERVRDLEAGNEPEPRSFSAGDGKTTSSLAAALQRAIDGGDVE